MYSLCFSRQLRNRHDDSINQGGFGLIELIVSISIIILVTSVVLTRHSAFTSVNLLKNQAFLLATAITETQQMAISNMSEGTGGGVVAYRNRYGIHFATSTTDKNYFVFIDQNGDRYFNAGGGEQIGSTGRIDPRISIQDIRYTSGGSLVSTQAISITFQRPNFDANFRRPTLSGSTDAAGPIEIALSSSETPGQIAVITVAPTGQVSVSVP